MNLTFYATASETRCYEVPEMSITEFFCIDGKVHVGRTTDWKGPDFIGEKWHEPAACDGICRAWKDQGGLGLDIHQKMPKDIEDACRRLLASSPSELK